MTNQTKSISLLTLILLFQMPAQGKNARTIWYENLTGVYTAIDKDDVEALDAELTKKNITDINDLPESPHYGPLLIFAAQRGKLKTLKHLVEKHHADVNVISQHGSTALTSVAHGDKAEHVEMTDYLISKKASLNGTGYRLKTVEIPLDICHSSFKKVKEYEILNSNCSLLVYPYYPAPYFVAKKWHKHESIYNHGHFVYAATIQNKLKQAYHQQTSAPQRLLNKACRTIRGLKK